MRWCLVRVGCVFIFCTHFSFLKSCTHFLFSTHFMLTLIFLSTFFFLHFSIINSTQTLSFFFFYKNATVFIFNEYENGKKVYSFFIFKITFLEIENENWVQITKLNQFFNGESHWKLKMKTKYAVFFSNMLSTLSKKSEESSFRKTTFFYLKLERKYIKMVFL